MKVQRQKVSPPDLWRFAEENLPSSLRACRVTVGYGTVDCVKAKVRGITHLFDEPVAVIRENSLEVFSPEYFSDMEDLVRKYEAKYGSEVTVKLWEQH